jgi:hypothetical protein
MEDPVHEAGGLPFLYELTPLDYPSPLCPSPLLHTTPSSSCPKEDILSSAFNMTLMGTDLQQQTLSCGPADMVADFLSETEEDFHHVGGGGGQPMASQLPEAGGALFPSLDEGVQAAGEPAYGGNVYYNEYEDYSFQERHSPSVN